MTSSYVTSFITNLQPREAVEDEVGSYSDGKTVRKVEESHGGIGGERSRSSERDIGGRAGAGARW